MSIEREDLEVGVDRVPYDESNPLKIRESIVTVKHIPTGIISIKRHMIQIVALNEAIREIESRADKNVFERVSKDGM